MNSENTSALDAWRVVFASTTSPWEFTIARQISCVLMTFSPFTTGSKDNGLSEVGVNLRKQPKKQPVDQSHSQLEGVTAL